MDNIFWSLQTTIEYDQLEAVKLEAVLLADDHMDQIVSVNGKETGKLMYEQIRDLLQASGETLTIEVVAA